MSGFITGYIAFQAVGIIVLIVVGVLSWFFWDKRYGKRRDTFIPPGFERTEEVSIDPTTGTVERVYYNPHTGDRLYISENGKGKERK